MLGGVKIWHDAQCDKNFQLVPLFWLFLLNTLGRTDCVVSGHQLNQGKSRPLPQSGDNVPRFTHEWAQRTKTSTKNPTWAQSIWMHLGEICHVTYSRSETIWDCCQTTKQLRNGLKRHFCLSAWKVTLLSVDQLNLKCKLWIWNFLVFWRMQYLFLVIFEAGVAFTGIEYFVLELRSQTWVRLYRTSITSWWNFAVPLTTCPRHRLAHHHASCHWLSPPTHTIHRWWSDRLGTSTCRRLLQICWCSCARSVRSGSGRGPGPSPATVTLFHSCVVHSSCKGGAYTAKYGLATEDSRCGDSRIPGGYRHSEGERRADATAERETRSEAQTTHEDTQNHVRVVRYVLGYPIVVPQLNCNEESIKTNQSQTHKIFEKNLNSLYLLAFWKWAWRNDDARQQTAHRSLHSDWSGVFRGRRIWRHSLRVRLLSWQVGEVSVD